MTKIGEAVAFTNLYRERAVLGLTGYLRRDPMALLELRPGRANPYPVHARLRKNGPLTLTRQGDLVTTSHRVVDAVLRDRHFGIRTENSPDMSMFSMNPPEHMRLRRLAIPAFSPRVVAGYQPRIERTVSDLLDRASAAGQFDMAADFAEPLPIAVITDLLGVPEWRAADFAENAMIFGTSLSGIKSLRHAEKLTTAKMGLMMLFKELFELRRLEPGEDLVSHLAAAQGEEQITVQEMMIMCILLLIAAFETTQNLIGNGVLALLDHRSQWELLCADPSGLAARAVEEVLRRDTPIQRADRYALSDLELEGKAVSRGQRVILLIGAANRDPEVYPDPDTFDIMRESTVGHLSFITGLHYCLGQGLARLQVRTAFEQLAERMPGLSRAGRVKWRDGTEIRGPLHLPVSAGTGRRREPVGAGVIRRPGHDPGAEQPPRLLRGLTDLAPVCTTMPLANLSHPRL